jgi:hypothetical protein
VLGYVRPVTRPGRVSQRFGGWRDRLACLAARSGRRPPGSWAGTTGRSSTSVWRSHQRIAAPARFSRSPAWPAGCGRAAARESGRPRGWYVRGAPIRRVTVLSGWTTTGADRRRARLGGCSSATT